MYCQFSRWHYQCECNKYILHVYINNVQVKCIGNYCELWSVLLVIAKCIASYCQRTVFRVVCLCTLSAPPHPQHGLAAVDMVSTLYIVSTHDMVSIHDMVSTHDIVTNTNYTRHSQFMRHSTYTRDTVSTQDTVNTWDIAHTPETQ